MNKVTLVAAPLALALALAACGATDDPDAPAEADTVEMPADDVMTQPGMDADPVVDDAVIATPTPEATDTAAPADQAADAAADAAADLEDAMGAEPAAE